MNIIFSNTKYLSEGLVIAKLISAKCIDIFAGTGSFQMVDYVPTKDDGEGDAVPLVDDALPQVLEPTDEIIKILTGVRRRRKKFRKWDVVGSGPGCQWFSIVHKSTPPKPKLQPEIPRITNRTERISTGITQEDRAYILYEKKNCCDGQLCPLVRRSVGISLPRLFHKVRIILEPFAKMELMSTKSDYDKTNLTRIDCRNYGK